MMLSEKFLFTDQKRSVPLYKLYTSVVRNECTDILLTENGTQKYRCRESVLHGGFEQNQN